MHLAGPKLHRKSYSTTEMCLRVHILPKWRKVPLTDINSRDVAGRLADRRAGGPGGWRGAGRG